MKNIFRGIARYSFYIGGIAILLLVTILLFVPVDVIASTVERIIGFDITNIKTPKSGKVINVLAQRYLIACFLICILTIYISIFKNFKKTINNLKLGLRFLMTYLRDTLKILKKSPITYFLVLYLVYLLYLAFTQNYNCDELTTYYFFIKAPFINAIASYPFPNNHVLFSVLGQLFSTFFSFLDLRLQLRLPSIMIAFLTCIITYRFLIKYYNPKIALWVTVLSMVAMSSIQYNFSARGYSLVILFSIVCFYASTNIIKENRKRDWVIFGLASVLGSYTIPTFVYPLATFNLYILLFSPRTIGKQIKYNLLILLGVFLVYFPILLAEGYSSIVENEYVTPISRMEVFYGLKDYLFDLPEYLLGVNRYICLFLFILSLAYAIFTKQWKIVALYALFIIVLPTILLSQGVLPFKRVFVYYNFLFVFLFFIPFSELFEKFKISPLISYSLLTVIVVVMWVKFPSVYDSKYSTIGEVNKRVTEKILEDNKSYYIVGSDFRLITLWDYLRFESAIHKYKNTKITYQRDIYKKQDHPIQYDYYIRDTNEQNTLMGKYSDSIYIPEFEFMIYKNSIK